MFRLVSNILHQDIEKNIKKIFNLECGLVFAQQNLIVGGITATAHSWPSIAYLRFDYATDITIGSITKIATQIYACAATLISRKILITAGSLLQLFNDVMFFLFLFLYRPLYNNRSHLLLSGKTI